MVYDERLDDGSSPPMQRWYAGGDDEREGEELCDETTDVRKDTQA